MHSVHKEPKTENTLVHCALCKCTVNGKAPGTECAESPVHSVHSEICTVCGVDFFCKVYAPLRPSAVST